MRVLFVNNNTNPHGGTLWCTRDMASALPDCETACAAVNGDWEGEAVELMQGVKCYALHGAKPHQVIRDFEPNVIVWQNTRTWMIPNSLPPDVYSVYYQHSHAPGLNPGKMCHKHFFVSHYLRDLMGVADSDRTFYQPVSEPPVGEHGEVKTSVTVYLDSHNPKKRSKAAQAAIESLSPVLVDMSIHARSSLHWASRVLIPSTLPESYGRIVCEAQRCRCIPVVRKRGGFIEQVWEGVTPKYGIELHGTSISRNLVDVDEMQKKARDRGSLKHWRERFIHEVSG